MRFDGIKRFFGIGSNEKKVGKDQASTGNLGNKLVTNTGVAGDRVSKNHGIIKHMFEDMKEIWTVPMSMKNEDIRKARAIENISIWTEAKAGIPSIPDDITKCVRGIFAKKAG